MLMTIYNHAFDIAFVVISEHEGESVTDEELLKGLRLRLQDLEHDHKQGSTEMGEACGMPFDTYEMTDEEARSRYPEWFKEGR